MKVRKGKPKTIIKKETIKTLMEVYVTKIKEYDKIANEIGKSDLLTLDSEEEKICFYLNALKGLIFILYC